MQYIVLVWPIVLPVLFWAWYHYYKDRHLPEPISHLLLAFFLGIGSYYPGLFMYESLEMFGLRHDAYQLAGTSLPGLFAYAILAIGMIEELAKMLPFLVIVIHLRAFDEPIDGIIYGSFIALGFAAMENIQYLQLVSTGEILARGFAGPVVHIVFASIWGYYIGRAWLCRKALLPVIFAALAFTAVLHGVYDFVVIALPTPVLPVAAFLIVGIWVWRLHLIRDLHALPAGRCPDGESDSSG